MSNGKPIAPCYAFSQSPETFAKLFDAYASVLLMSPWSANVYSRFYKQACKRLYSFADTFLSYVVFKERYRA